MGERGGLKAGLEQEALCLAVPTTGLLYAVSQASRSQRCLGNPARGGEGTVTSSLT